MQRDALPYDDEYAKQSKHKKIRSPYIVDVYDLNMVESAQLTKGRMLAVADHMPWAKFGVLIGIICNFYSKLHGDIPINAPFWEHNYVS